MQFLKSLKELPRRFRESPINYVTLSLRNTETDRKYIATARQLARENADLYMFFHIIMLFLNFAFLKE